MRQPISNAAKRYLWRFLPSMAAYIVVLMGIVTWFQLSPPQGAVRYLGAVAPAVPLLGCIWSMGAFLTEEQDEFERMVVIRAMLWGIGLTLAATTVWGFLETFADAPRFPLYLVFPLFTSLFGIAQAPIRRSFR